MTKRKDEGSDHEPMPELGISRRALLRRGAIAGGTLLWVAPVIKSLTPPALAGTNGSPFGETCCCQCSTGGAGGDTFVSCGDGFTNDPQGEADCQAACGAGATSSLHCGEQCNETSNECEPING